jgi:hypothetical protein
MAEEKLIAPITPITPIEERTYIISPHPPERIVEGETVVEPGEVEYATETLSDLIAEQLQDKVEGLRSELLSEIQIERTKEGIVNAKN